MSRPSPRRRALASAALALAAATIAFVAAPAAAQEGPIRLVVPFGPGTTTDTIGRIVAEGLAKATKQSVIVDNKAGAGGTIGSDQVAKAAADGRYHPAAVMPQIRAGKLRALGASSAIRASAAPDVPTLQEQGVKDFDLVAWFMLYAPAGMPEPALARLRAAAGEAMAQADMVERLKTQGVEMRNLRPEDLTAFGRTEIAKWAELVKRSGAQVD